MGTLVKNKYTFKQRLLERNILIKRVLITKIIYFKINRLKCKLNVIFLEKKLY